MGLDASVMCNCFARGLTTPAPSPVAVDAEGWLDLGLPWEGHRAEHDAFYAWRRSACAHENMEAASQRIANWSGYRMFQDALAAVGWEHFPALRAALPEGNGGLCPAEASAICLRELDEFERLYRAEVSALFDDDTGQVLQEHVSAYQGLFLYGATGIQVGVDDAGLFVRESDPPHRECFRAMRIAQRPLLVDGKEGAELLDVDGDARLVLAVRISGHAIQWPDGRMQDDRGRYHFSTPSRMHVARAERTAASLDALPPLRLVFRASVETGNPVRWL